MLWPHLIILMLQHLEVAQLLCCLSLYAGYFSPEELFLSSQLVPIAFACSTTKNRIAYDILVLMCVP